MVERKTTVTRLGEGLEATGRLSSHAIGRVADAVAGYRELLDRHGAEAIACVATSAMRDAENGDELRDLLRERFGIEARIISGDEEARLTFLGATHDQPTRDPTLVFDIGGGSTEYVVGHPGQEPSFHVSTQVGSVRHSERHLHSDPPAPAELETLARDVDGVLGAEVPGSVRATVERGIAVAGTATSLAAIDLRLDPYDPERVHGHRLALATCERILARLAGLSARGAQEGHRTRSRPRPHHRGRRRHPGPLAALVRPRRDPRERGRHPARRRARNSPKRVLIMSQFEPFPTAALSSIVRRAGSRSRAA